MNDRPFTAVVCQVGAYAGTARPLIERLRVTTRRCPHGVLVSAGCLLGAARCGTAPAHDSGAYLLVQPCDLDRRPIGVGIRVGPVLSDADAGAVAEWLADGDLDARRLDRRLLTTAGPTHL